jgi:hypothetical protein
MNIFRETRSGFILMQNNYGIIAIGKLENNNGTCILRPLNRNDELMAARLGLGFSIPGGAPVVT